MSPFENLSDDPILHIFSYLPRDDLLNLSLMDKNFNRIITESRETKIKIPLILDFKQKHVIKDIMKLARKRQFASLKLTNVKMVIGGDFQKLLKYLSESVEHIEIRSSQFQEDHFRKLIQLYLPKLKTCKMFDIHGEYNAREKVSDVVIPSHPLRTLILDNNEMLKFFAGCKLLKSFHFSGNRHHSRVFEFLSHQTHLEKLSIDCRSLSKSIDLSRIRCIHLKELELPFFNMAAVADYLEKLPNLEKLKVAIFDQPSLLRLLKAICSAPMLVDLAIDVFGGAKSFINLPILVEPLFNHIVKKLTIIEDRQEVTLWLVQIFQSVDSVSLLCSSRSARFRDNEFCINFLDPSEVPHETIGKIKFEHVQELFHIQFCPRWVPDNVERFESAVTKFAERFATTIGTITIGHKNWRNDGDFKLSNLFCMQLVRRLPNLTKLELFNVRDRGVFLTCLDRNREVCKNLEKVKLHMPIEPDEPDLKRMKVEAD